MAELKFKNTQLVKQGEEPGTLVLQVTVEPGDVNGKQGTFFYCGMAPTMIELVQKSPELKNVLIECVTRTLELHAQSGKGNA